MCMNVLLACMHVHYVYAVAVEARRGCQNPHNWSFMWVMGTDPGSSARSASAFNHGATFVQCTLLC